MRFNLWAIFTFLFFLLFWSVGYGYAQEFFSSGSSLGVTILFIWKNLVRVLLFVFAAIVVAMINEFVFTNKKMKYLNSLR